ncbi:MAG: hypothetical protein FRX49_02410 [Trebouxia sp. A1-2]|nr:MAG: hypothetical protein FRX49_02410 [Trebouxia sp. A1-2]
MARLFFRARTPILALFPAANSVTFIKQQVILAFGRATTVSIGPLLSTSLQSSFAPLKQLIWVFTQQLLSSCGVFIADVLSRRRRRGLEVIIIFFFKRGEVVFQINKGALGGFQLGLGGLQRVLASELLNIRKIEGRGGMGEGGPPWTPAGWLPGPAAPACSSPSLQPTASPAPLTPPVYTTHHYHILQRGWVGNASPSIH